MRRAYGWRRDRLDHRDYRSHRPLTVPLPQQVDLRPGCPPVYDQGQLGSCTANALAAAFDFERRRQGLEFITPSRLFIYYNERVAEGTVDQDAGAELRDGIKTLNQQGACPESLWPYVVERFTMTPGPECFGAALKDRALRYARIEQTALAMKIQLAAGYPFVFGFSVFGAFEGDTVARTGVVPLPAKDEAPLGGHAVLAVGYDDARQAFLVRNSWGATWGLAGHFWLPYAYLMSPDLASDFWDVTLVEQP